MKVNKELKAEYRDSIKKFFEWGMIMSPLLPLERYYIMERMDELRKYLHPEEAWELWNPEWSRSIFDGMKITPCGYTYGLCLRPNTMTAGALTQRT